MTDALALDARLAPHDLARVRHLGDEAVVLHLGTGQMYAFDAVAARMWRALAEGGSLRAARDVLAGEYEVEAGRLEADLRAFTAELIGEGLLETRAEAKGR